MTLTSRLRFDHTELLAIVFFCLATLFTAIAYFQGVGGSLHFDDRSSLNGLASIDDAASALTFSLEGTAGVLGRPLALMSFIPQRHAWPDSPEVLLATNVALHLLNGVLVALMFYLLSVSRGYTRSHAALTGSMSGAIWMALPILASSSLLVVQRMTTLSALFIVLAIISYLYFRLRIERSPKSALIGMSLSLIFGTILAAFSKENGALLPALVLVMEGTLLVRPKRGITRTAWRTWCSVFLVAPSAIILCYLALNLSYTEAMILRRDFDAVERLLTQAHVLWTYLYNAFLPNIAALGPFHDHHPIYRDWTNPLSLLVVTSWFVVALAAGLLRRRAPLFAFGAWWYLAGHALESTTLPLELYFEHRNYVPLIGPVFSFTAGALTAFHRYQTIVRIGLSAYGLLLMAILFSFTSMWGRPQLAAEMWAIHNPNSVRAAQYLSEQLQTDGYYVAAHRLIQSLSEQRPDHPGLRLQALGLSCITRPNIDKSESVETISDLLATARFSHGVVETLEILYGLVDKGKCPSIDERQLYLLAEATAKNPAFQEQAIVHHNLHVLMSRMGVLQYDLDLTMRHLELALDSYATAATLEVAIEVLHSAGLESIAEDFVDRYRSRPPGNLLRVLIWERQIRTLMSKPSETA